MLEEKCMYISMKKRKLGLKINIIYTGRLYLRELTLNIPTNICVKESKIKDYIPLFVGSIFSHAYQNIPHI